ncbi:MAG: DUF4446 family protein [Caldicoprobacterales bacterium]|jgi:hypothetical protein|nr:DUF4446 family protein [Clostridia bacterium]MDI9513332.1 DUF4446 family protein [Bacillota bacterium]NLH59157.1 DUF4446 family protein [Clostridiales bacterium]
MKEILELLKDYSLELLLASIFIGLICLILLIVNYSKTNKLIKKYNRLMKGADNKNLEAMLISHLDTIKDGLSRLDDIEADLKNQNARLKKCTQNIGLVRYNAFDQMGGDQSFSVALLDDRGDGFVLTNLYGRNSSSTFAKPVKLRQSTYPLTNEEMEAIERAYYPKGE